ncbi:MAG: hypothetical protein AABX85_04430 [Nanoarchaeota archaeon]
MAVPSSRHRAGKIEIDNKEREAKKKLAEVKKNEITPEEHEERLQALKDAGILG